MEPGADDQADARALRINSAGERVFSYFDHQTFRDHHLKAVRDGKNAAEILFNEEKNADAIQQLRYFGTYVLEQCYKSELYDSKDIEIATKKRVQMEALLQRFYDSVDRNNVENAIVSNTPKPNYPSSISQAEGGIIPLAYGTTYDEVIKQAYLFKQQPQQVLSIIDKITNPNWREEFRKATFAPDHQEEKRVHPARDPRGNRRSIG